MLDMEVRWRRSRAGDGPRLPRALATRDMLLPAVPGLLLPAAVIGKPGLEPVDTVDCRASENAETKEI